MLRSSSLALLCLASLNAIAHAQDAPADPGAGAAAAPAPMPPGPAPAAPPPPGAAPAAAPDGGLTLRNGFSLSIGEEFGSGPSSGLSGQLYGVDWRIGARVKDAIAVYLHSHLSLGTAKIGTASGLTGNFAAAVVGEYTLPMRIFVGGGGGYGVLNNPSGPLAQLRAGWYPFEHSSAGKARRLNVAFDARWYFAGDNVGTVSHLALSLGYDRF